MTPEEQIKALAEVDGWTCNPANGFCAVVNSVLQTYLCRRSDGTWTGLPDYLTSYDAIIPLIQKLWKNDVITTDFNVYLTKAMNFPFQPRCIEAFEATPSQLCEALLRATNKWKE